MGEILCYRLAVFRQRLPGLYGSICLIVPGKIVRKILYPLPAGLAAYHWVAITFAQSVCAADMVIVLMGQQNIVYLLALFPYTTLFRSSVLD